EGRGGGRQSRSQDLPLRHRRRRRDRVVLRVPVPVLLRRSDRGDEPRRLHRRRPDGHRAGRWPRRLRRPAVERIGGPDPGQEDPRAGRGPSDPAAGARRGSDGEGSGLPGSRRRRLARPRRPAEAAGRRRPEVDGATRGGVEGPPRVLAVPAGRAEKIPATRHQDGDPQMTQMKSPSTSTSARNEVRTVAPKLIELSEKVLYRSEEHTSELQSRFDLVCRLLLEKKK